MKEQCEKEMSLYEEAAKLLKQGIEFNRPLIVKDIESQEGRVYEELRRSIGLE